MTKYFMIALFSLFIVSSAALAGTPQTITLKDGSVIHGQVLGMENNQYTIESPLAGTIHVPQDQIVSMSAANQDNAPTPTSGAPSSINSTDITNAQNKILANPDAMKDIQTLASDPEVVALMNDPALLQAVQSKDLAAIQANPRTQQLMSNPKIKALIEKLQAQGQH